MHEQKLVIEDLERGVLNAMGAGRRKDAIDGVFALAEIVSDHRWGGAAAALFPYVMTVCADDGRAVGAAEELKHAIMRFDPSADLDALSERLTVDSSNMAYVALKLLQGEVLSAAEYILLLERLGHVLADKRDDHVVSILHLLREKGAASVEKALVFMTRDTGVPLLPLSRFWPQAQAYRVLPGDYAVARGAFAFDQIEDALLIALLNPYDKALQQEVQWQEDQKCLFYLVAPDDYDGALKLLRT